MGNIINWNEKVVDFVKSSFLHEARKKEDFLNNYLLKVKQYTAADIVLVIKQQDEFLATICQSIPDYYTDFQIHVSKIRHLFDTTSDDNIYTQDRSRVHDEIFGDLLVAMASSVIIPARHKHEHILMVLGWSAQQDFNAGFKNFLTILRYKSQEIYKNAYYRNVTNTNIDLMAAVFHKLPQAIVYIDDDGHTSWANFSAAALLGLSIYGKQATIHIARSLHNLRSKTVNRDAIEQRAAEIFQSRYISIDQWLWHFDDPSIDFKTLCVSTRAVKSSGNSGRLWIFEDVTALNPSAS